jgi:hypothetical protein
VLALRADSVTIDFVHPSVWRRAVRDEARRLGWTPRRMRRYLRERGMLYCDPWRVPLPVLNGWYACEVCGKLRDPVRL